jgi:pimeloyl-ACP methyl ester carboxylesterase
MRWLRTVWFAVVVLSSGLAWPAWADDAPPPRYLRVNGVELAYIEQGTGAAVIFVHGAFSDLRIWEAQRPAVAQQYRFIAYNQRYHGTDPWLDAGQRYGAATHAADLAALIRQLNAGPVSLVAHSYGGIIATMVALDHPDLVRSLTLAEPGFRALLVDLPKAELALDELGEAGATIRTAVKAGDAVQATKLAFEWVNKQGAGAFDTQPQALRQMFLDNARTFPLLLSAPPPPAISCATLGRVQAPTLVIAGAHTQRYYALISEGIVRCLPGTRLVTIPEATHPMFVQQPAAFNAVLVPFLAQP